MRRFMVDTEWTAVPWSEHRDLLWIGLACSNGETFCGLNADCRVHASRQQYTADLLALITPEVPRLPRDELSSRVQEFCGEFAEFWAWIPSLAGFAAWSTLGSEAASVYERCRDIDLQMLQSLVNPWPPQWSPTILDLNAAATKAGVAIPARAKNHLHPRVHALWNQKLFSLIQAAQSAP